MDRVRYRSHFIAALGIFCLCFSLSVVAGTDGGKGSQVSATTTTPGDDGAKQLPVRKVTMQFQGVGAREALSMLLENSGFSFVVSDSVSNDVKINVEVRDAPWRDVFQQLLAAANAEYEIHKTGILEVRGKTGSGGKP